MGIGAGMRTGDGVVVEEVGVGMRADVVAVVVVVDVGVVGVIVALPPRCVVIVGGAETARVRVGVERGEGMIGDVGVTGVGVIGTGFEVVTGGGAGLEGA